MTTRQDVKSDDKRKRKRMETREQSVSKLMDESEKLQYDESDSQRIYDVSGALTESFVNLLNKIADFRNESVKEVNEDSASQMKQLRLELVENYANALIQLHKLGNVFRISGEAFDRMVKHLSGPEEAPLVMSDL